MITDKCTSKCRHCSNTQILGASHVISPNKSKEILSILTNSFKIESVMAFGGEPLLYPEVTTDILSHAKKLNIERRQIITNCYWSKKYDRIDEISHMLKKADVNDILISVDCFHQEHLDFKIIDYTISQLCNMELPSIKLHPCWYISKDSNNKYDSDTRSYLKKLSKYNLEVTEGNILFPAGNAVKNFPDRFEPIQNISEIVCGKAPYTERPDHITSIGINPDGKVSSSCFGDYMEVEEFIRNYNPYKDKLMHTLLTSGFKGIHDIAKQKGIDFDIKNYYSVCDACSDLRKRIEDKL
ncbi:MAG: radical SAM protein [Candidatus Delongbacteria bacterium]|nr:radical SAM protein [Candidatus Delongbacteria bacterium]